MRAAATPEDINPLVSRLRLRQVALVVALDVHRSLRKAADALAISQPAATRLLRELEQALGVPLFIRHAFGMEPTPFGESFTRHARSLLSDVEEARGELRSLAAGARGVLRIGCVTGAVPGWLVPTVRAVRKSRPGLRLYLLVNTSDVLCAALLAGTLDAAIGRLPDGLDAQSLGTTPLGDEPLQVVARDGHPLARRRHVTAADLASASWILQPPGSPTRGESNAMLDALGVRVPADVIETASIVATLALLRETDALSVMPADLAAHYAAPGWLKVLRTPAGGRGSRYELITRRGRTLAPAASAFVDALAAIAAARRGATSSPGRGRPQPYRT